MELHRKYEESPQILIVDDVDANPLLINRKPPPDLPAESGYGFSRYRDSGPFRFRMW